MGRISLRLPESLHETARDLAREENVSINQLITLALAEKMSALMTERYLNQRAKRGSRAKFSKALAKAANVKPEERDRLKLPRRRHQRSPGRSPVRLAMRANILGPISS
jgi:hypothetical protein